MHQKLVIYRAAYLLIVLVCLTGAWLARADAPQYLTVSFLDVGQGDAIFIETPAGRQILIDGGPDAGVLRELVQVMPWFDRSIDVVIATHPDQDHIGGLIDVLARYQVALIMGPDHSGDTPIAAAYQEAVRQESATVQYGTAGQVVDLGGGVYLTVLSPAGDPSQLETNTASLVMKVTYGTTDFILTGDAPVGIEQYVGRRYGTFLESEVLKLGHHGSDTSTSAEFLALVEPQYAVVSAGQDNRYGHPHPAVIERVETSGALVRSTAALGTVTFASDGVNLWEL